MDRKRLALFLLVALLAVLPALSPAPLAAATPADWDIPNGHFFTQTGGDSGRGYTVTDEGGIRFWSEFQRLGGVQAVGYPASQRFEWDGFTVQVFQRVVFQWRPEVGQVYFVNVFDRLHDLGHDDWLLSARQTPRPKQWQEAGQSWAQIVASRLAVLDAYPAIKAKYAAVVGDPIQANGLPTSEMVDMGNHYALRAQRVVFQQWKEDVPWARRGEVTVALGGDIAKETGVLPDQVALQPVAAPGPGRSNRQVFGYYVPYDWSSWVSLQENASAIDYIGAQWVSINACGYIGSRDNQTVKQFAQSRGIKVLPSLLTSSAWLNNRILNDEATSARAISQIVNYVVAEGYDGFDLDFEGIQASDRAAYTSFVARLGTALRERGKLFTMAVPPKTREVTTGQAAAYDYAALGGHADLITIMTYAYSGSFGGPGSIAPYNWVDQVMAYTTSQIPARKVNLGLAFYGYDWNVTSGGARALRYPQAAWLSDRYQVPFTHDAATRSATFRFSAPYSDPPAPAMTVAAPQHQITERTAAPCAVTPPSPPTPTPGPSPTPRPTPRPTDIQEHVVWIEDSASAAARLEIANRYQTAGIGTWRLGQEDSRVWPILRQWRQGQ